MSASTRQLSSSACRPNSRWRSPSPTAPCITPAQEVGEALGAQAGEANLTEVLAGAGFGQVRRANEGAFNTVLEARP